MSQHAESKTRRQQEDLRRMQFRRAIEDYSEMRRLNQDIAEFPDLIAANYLSSQAAAERSARPAR
ncbi:PA3496 family putative envelope integrity protein [Pseudomonas sp. LRF_L74]|uniref:PA3496 family putative envelope integrity protein n=1 Tax=Pseudomonas sp. LRF_L74 TaxID=3369422 RepID=UPI003F5F9C92